MEKNYKWILLQRLSGWRKTLSGAFSNIGKVCRPHFKEWNHEKALMMCWYNEPELLSEIASRSAVLWSGKSHPIMLIHKRATVLHPWRGSQEFLGDKIHTTGCRPWKIFIYTAKAYKQYRVYQAVHLLSILSYQEFYSDMGPSHLPLSEM